jgi:hypothetical protein
MNRKADVFEVILALRAPRGFACGLDCRQKQRNQDADNGNYDEQFDKRKRCAFPRAHRRQLYQCKAARFPYLNVRHGEGSETKEEAIGTGTFRNRILRLANNVCKRFQFYFL